MEESSAAFALIVEPDERLRVLVADVVSSKSYLVERAKTADEAGSLATQVAFAVVVVGPGTSLRTMSYAIKLIAANDEFRLLVKIGADADQVVPDLVEKQRLLVIPGSEAATVVESLRSSLPDASVIARSRGSSGD